MTTVVKPNWNDAPTWANWLAMDKSYKWYWYHNKPGHLGFAWDFGFRWARANPEVKEWVGEPYYHLAWTETLEARP